jgi:prophage regulatory protein
MAQSKRGEKAAAPAADGNAMALVPCAGNRPPLRFLSKPDVLERVGVSYVSIWTWMRAGKFPRSVQIGGKVAWYQHEVEDWIASRPIQRLKGDP